MFKPIYKLREWTTNRFVDPEKLSCNPNQNEYLEKNLNNINWYAVSLNPSVIPMLEKNLDKVNW